MNPAVRPTQAGISISLHVQPGASKTEWSGLLAGSLKLRLASKPIAGEANKELCTFLAQYFSVPKSAVRVQHGHAGRKKVIAVMGDPRRLMQVASSLITI